MASRRDRLRDLTTSFSSAAPPVCPPSPGVSDRRSRIAQGVNPDEVVAVGATLSRRHPGSDHKGRLLIDADPLSLGIRAKKVAS